MAVLLEMHKALNVLLRQADESSLVVKRIRVSKLADTALRESLLLADDYKITAHLGIPYEVDESLPGMTVSLLDAYATSPS